jgi:hypothetical protein
MRASGSAVLSSATVLWAVDESAMDPPSRFSFGEGPSVWQLRIAPAMRDATRLAPPTCRLAYGLFRTGPQEASIFNGEFPECHFRLRLSNLAIHQSTASSVRPHSNSRFNEGC